MHNRREHNTDWLTFFNEGRALLGTGLGHLGRQGVPAGPELVQLAGSVPPLVVQRGHPGRITVLTEPALLDVAGDQRKVVSKKLEVQVDGGACAVRVMLIEAHESNACQVRRVADGGAMHKEGDWTNRRTVRVGATTSHS